MSYYEILGVSKDATLIEIKKAFRVKALLYHPDVNSAPSAKEQFELVYIAYDILSDSYKRVIYDEHLLQRTTPVFNAKPRHPSESESLKSWRAEARKQAAADREMEYEKYQKKLSVRVTTKFLKLLMVFMFFLLAFGAFQTVFHLLSLEPFEGIYFAISFGIIIGAISFYVAIQSFFKFFSVKEKK